MYIYGRRDRRSGRTPRLRTGVPEIPPRRSRTPKGALRSRCQVERTRDSWGRARHLSVKDVVPAETLGATRGHVCAPLVVSQKSYAVPVPERSARYHYSKIFAQTFWSVYDLAIVQV